jgi:transposase-like protein
MVPTLQRVFLRLQYAQILLRFLSTAGKSRARQYLRGRGIMKEHTVFTDLFAAYDSNPREKLWRHLQKIRPDNI